MSSGRFTTAIYETSAENGGFKLRCRVQPETLAASFGGTENAAPSGPTTAPGSATISQGRRTAGVNMRYVTVEWTGDPPDDYDGLTARIVVLDPAVFADWAFEATGTYLGTAAKIVGRTGETVR
jgi:hypothetical protein